MAQSLFLFFSPFLLCLFVIANINEAPHQSTSNYLFAQSYKLDDLFKSMQMQDDFLMQACWWEGKFAGDGIGVNFLTGLTFFGVEIDLDTGAFRESLWTESSRSDVRYTAPESEAIHLSLLALALTGNKFALNFFKSSMQETADWANATMEEFLVDQLTKKIYFYRKYLHANPGFGGYFPMLMASNNNGLHLFSDIQNIDNPGMKIDGPGNGALCWALVAAIQAMKENDHVELASQYTDYFTVLIENGLTVFYHCGLFQYVSVINSKAPIDATIRGNIVPLGVDPTFDDGNLLMIFFFLYANWSSTGADAESNRYVQWTRFRWYHFMKTVFRTQSGRNITIELTDHFSSEEKLKYLWLPFFDVSIAEAVYLNDERARSIFSAESKLPGLLATVCKDSWNIDSLEYPVSVNPGIQMLASGNNYPNAIIAPYAAFPLILHWRSRAFGVVWYAAMLQGALMQGQLGATENTKIAGDAVTFTAEWHHKSLVVLAIAGGVSNLTRSFLNDSGKLDEFKKRIKYEWTLLFGNKTLEGSDIEFARPSAQLADDNKRFNCDDRLIYVYCTTNKIICGKFWFEVSFNIAGIFMVAMLFYFSFHIARSERTASYKYFTRHIFAAHFLTLVENLAWILIIKTKGFVFSPRQPSAYVTCLHEYIQLWFLDMCFFLMTSLTTLSVLFSFLQPIRYQKWFRESKVWNFCMSACYLLAAVLPSSTLNQCYGITLFAPTDCLRTMIIFAYFLPICSAIAAGLMIIIVGFIKVGAKRNLLMLGAVLNYSAVPLVWCLGIQAEEVWITFRMVIPILPYGRHTIEILREISFYFHATFGVVHATSTAIGLKPYRQALTELFSRKMKKLRIFFKPKQQDAKMFIVNRNRLSSSEDKTGT